ncbi:putative small intestine urate exporter [Rhinolophus sinicus]|uniref:putative small intestine urate exporter n=1 Tax=Rhinolophus sinicus TaxID=89399 RepID=UPI003D7AAE5E
MSTRAEAKATVGDISNDGDLNTAQTQISRKGFCSVRHGMALILHFCNFSILTQQMNLSITIPAMVNNTALPSLPNASIERPPTGSPNHWNETRQASEPVAPVYDWSPEIQGVLLSSLNYGSLLASVPAGYLVGIFGIRYLVGAAVFISSALNLFIPLAADAGVALLIVLRTVQGIAQVLTSIGQYSIWVKWAPPLERNQLVGITISGSSLGALIIFLAGGVLCQTLGWPYVFYIFGGIGCACSCLWFLLIYDDPVEHPFISTRERDYIVHSLAQQDCVPEWSVPIKAMMKSLPLWAIIVSHFSEYWYFYILMGYTPTYISSVLQVSLTESGFLSALMLGVTFMCTFLGGLLADCLLSRKLLRLIVIRKLFTAVGVLLPTVFSVSLSWVTSSFSTTIAFLVLCFAAGSLCQTGALLNFLDIAPRYSGFLKGFLLVFSQISGAISPTVAGVFISQDSEVGWRNVFLLSAAINVSGLIFYLIFAQAKVQDWAKKQTVTHL